MKLPSYGDPSESIITGDNSSQPSLLVAALILQSRTWSLLMYRAGKIVWNKQEWREADGRVVTGVTELIVKLQQFWILLCGKRKEILSQEVIRKKIWSETDHGSRS